MKARAAIDVLARHRGEAVAVCALGFKSGPPVSASHKPST